MSGNITPTDRETLALGWLSAELAARSDAWSGNAPAWFPEPPEWLELWSKALTATAGVQDSLDAALEAGERSHILTIGSPLRGLCLRVTAGHLSRSGRWHGWMPDVFLIWRGRRV